MHSLEIEVERLKGDLRSSRINESELRSQLTQLTNSEKTATRDCAKWHTQADQLETK
jgi:hypothetical protein